MPELTPPPRAVDPANQSLIEPLSTLEPIDEEIEPIEDYPPEPIDPLADGKDDNTQPPPPAGGGDRAAPLTIREGGLDHPAVQALIRLHIWEALASTPLGYRHPIDAEGLLAHDVRFWTAWDGDTLLGMAALRTLEPGHVELKSMRTAPAALRRGVARALLAHLLAQARAGGAMRMSLETGTAPMFDAANRLYESAGFSDGPVFGGYPPSPHNRFMTRAL